MSGPVSDAWSGRDWSSGDVVVWPNGTVGKVCGVDFSDDTLLDDCGGWHSMNDCDLVESVA